MDKARENIARWEALLAENEALAHGEQNGDILKARKNLAESYWRLISSEKLLLSLLEMQAKED